MNGRMDTIQAAILLEKLTLFPEEILLRQKIADRYSHGLQEVAQTPFVRDDCQSAWAQYTLKVDPSKRKELMEGLRQEGIPSVIYYPLPLHHQKAYSAYACATETLPVSEGLSKTVLSLPLHPYLAPDTQDHIIKTFCDVSTRVAVKKVA
ncbi:MAG: DegT/DnrJ/EryC1/StrS family aminotransferase, partial [Proteobacteria bacterium]|nr:DegT/DnrJ/EryC1/StrS family aminotransferase [Pseudomonadota bacterium]